jgi:muconolactone delta-isomerase
MYDHLPRSTTKGILLYASLASTLLFPFVWASGGTYAAAASEEAGSHQELKTNLTEFWPLDTPPRSWNLIEVTDRVSQHPSSMMLVENENTAPGEFVLWFSHKKGQRQGERDGEHYRLCTTPERDWLFLDSYIKSIPGQPPIVHEVQTDKVLLSRSDGLVVDVIADGEYQLCGTSGQPYLVWSGARHRYRIQVWGHLKENSRFRWFWDASVTGPEVVVDECMKPVQRSLAIRVQEVWWNNFRQPSGVWALGAGETQAGESIPNGKKISYGRTVWHGAGRFPYLMTGDALGKPTWCVNEVRDLHREP